MISDTLRRVRERLTGSGNTGPTEASQADVREAITKAEAENDGEEPKLMADGGTVTTPTNPNCPECGRFCGVSMRTFGDSGLSEVPFCRYCGIHPPKCAKETGTVYGCQTRSTHVEQVGGRRERFWCADHAPDDADPLPYYEGEAELVTDGGAVRDPWSFVEGEVICEDYEAYAPGGIGVGKTEYLIKRRLRSEDGGDRFYHVENDEGKTHLYAAAVLETSYGIIDPVESTAFDPSDAEAERPNRGGDGE